MATISPGSALFGGVEEGADGASGLELTLGGLRHIYPETCIQCCSATWYHNVITNELQIRDLPISFITKEAMQ